MIQLDLANLRFRALNVAGCYMSGIDNGKVKSVKIDGVVSNSVFYCDINLGLAIYWKKDLSGKPLILDGDFVYEFVFGVIEVEFNDME